MHTYTFRMRVLTPWASFRFSLTKCSIHTCELDEWSKIFGIADFSEIVVSIINNMHKLQWFVWIIVITHACMIMEEGDYVKTQELFQSATKEFGKVGQGELKDLSMALGLYSSGITELQRFNIGQGSKLLKKVKNYLRNAGKFGSKYETLIDHMEPDVFFVSGIQALQAYDYATGKTLIDKASQAAEHAARNYHKEGTPLYCKLQGMARLQQAYFTFFRALKEFNAFEYDKLAADRDLASDAIQAQGLLDKANPEDIHVRKMNHLSKALVQLLEVIRELAKLMQTILHSTFKPDLQTLALFKEKIRKAINSLSEVGPHYVPFVRLCN